MLPVFNHEVETHRWPYMTICLIGVNVLVFAFEVTVGARLVPFFQDWGVVPGRIETQLTVDNVLTIAPSLFLHVGAVQLLGNMLFLYVVGDAVEDAFGRWWYLGLYLASGLIGTVVYVAVAHNSAVPAVGATGAVAGVMAASLLLWPKARFRVPGVLLLLYVIGLMYELMVLIGTPSWLLGGGLSFVGVTFGSLLFTRKAGGFIRGLLNMVGLPAWLVLALFVSLQLFSGSLLLVSPAFAGAMGYGVYIGGFAAGLAMAWVFPNIPYCWPTDLFWGDLMPSHLRCPHCGVDLDFAAWRESATCQSCRQRVRFEEALAAGAAPPAPAPPSGPPVAAAAPAAAAPPAVAASPAAAVPTSAGRPTAATSPDHAPFSFPPAAAPSPPPAVSSAAAPASGAFPAGPVGPCAAVVPPVGPPAFSVSYSPAVPREPTILGKSPGWNTAWTAVVLVWALVAIGLAGARIGVGHLGVYTAREAAAVQEVRGAQFQPGVSNAQALVVFTKRVGSRGQRASWSVQDRQWQDRFYVSWALGSNEPLGWTVSYSGAVAPQGGTVAALKGALQTPVTSPTTLPSIPGL